MEKSFMIIKGGPTKEEVLAISLFKLNIEPSDVFVDIGCGTGSVSIAAAKIANKVFAIDYRYEAIRASSFNFREAGISHKVELIHDEATKVLERLTEIDCAFVGGSKNLEKVLKVLSDKVRKKIVVNVARIETLLTAIKTMKTLGIFEEAIHLQVSKTYELAGGIAFKPDNPVYIIVGGKKT